MLRLCLFSLLILQQTLFERPAVLNLITIIVGVAILILPLTSRKRLWWLFLLPTLAVLITHKSIDNDLPQVDASIVLSTQGEQTNLVYLPGQVQKAVAKRFSEVQSAKNYQCDKRSFGCWEYNVINRDAPSNLLNSREFALRLFVNSQSGAEDSALRYARGALVNSLDYNWLDLPMFPDGIRSDISRERPPLVISIQAPEKKTTRSVCVVGGIFIYPDGKQVAAQAERRCISFEDLNGEIYAFFPQISDKQAVFVEKDLAFQSLWLIYITGAVALTLAPLLFIAGNKVPLRIALSLAAYSATLVATFALFPSTDTLVHEGGNDGLVHYGYGKQMYVELSNQRFSEALRGGVDVFYYMPGARYINMMSIAVFGEGLFLLLALTSVLPIAVVLIAWRLSDHTRLSTITCSTIVVVLILNLYFSEIVSVTARGYGDSAATALMVLALCYTVLASGGELKALAISLLLVSVAVLIRPVYALCGVWLYVYWAFAFGRYNQKRLFVVFICGLPTLLPLMHNLYYGNSFTLFTSAVDISANLLVPPHNYISAVFGTYEKEAFVAIASHLYQFFTYGGKWPLWILLSLFSLVIWINRRSKFCKPQVLIAVAAVTSTLPLLFYHNEYRYAHLAYIMIGLLAFGRHSFDINREAVR